MEFTAMGLEIIVTNADGHTGRGELMMKVAGKPTRTKLDRRFIEAALSNVKEDTVSLEWKDDFSPVVLKAANYTGIIMPIRTGN